MQAGQQGWQLENISLITNHIQTQESFPINLSMTWRDPQDLREIEVNHSGDLKLSNLGKKIELIDSIGIIKSHLLQQEIYPLVNISYQGKFLSFDWQKRQWSMNPWEFQAFNGRLQLSLTSSDDKGTQGQVMTSKVEFDKWSNQLRLPIPKKIQALGLTNENAVFDWHYDSALQEVIVDQVTLQVVPK